MGIEIEIKAKVDDVAKTRALMDKCLHFRGSFEKEDAYWLNESFSSEKAPVYGLRIRKEAFTNAAGQVSKAVTATYKTKNVSAGMEINTEKEFSVNGIDEFEGFLTLTGLKVDLKKRKTGFSYVMDDLTAELCEVEGLGWFVEIEIIKDNMLEETVKAARKRLFDCLAVLEISKDAVEKRFYSELLKEKAKFNVL